MTETKFTPGPWRAVPRNNDGHDQWSIAAPDGATYIEQANTVWICHTPNKRRQRTLVETDANARLIAAAPELFEALEKLVGLDGFLWDWGKGERPDIDEARALLSRIRGEEVS